MVRGAINSIRKTQTMPPYKSLMTTRIFSKLLIVVTMVELLAPVFKLQGRHLTKIKNIIFRVTNYLELTREALKIPRRYFLTLNQEIWSPDQTVVARKLETTFKNYGLGLLLSNLLRQTLN